MKLSVVVPAFNEEKLLPRTLECLSQALEAVRAAGWSSEVIVCDNNSTDRTPAIADAAGARVVFEPVNQIARARNTGAGAATGDWLLFLDADASPTPALFADMLEAMAQSGCVGGGSTLAFPGAPLYVRAWLLLWNALSRVMRWAAGAFFFCEARAFRAVGGFSEDFYAGEEVDLSRRLQRLGRFRILRRHPLVTSDRKVHLYSTREQLAFLLKLLTRGTGALRRRDACTLWYDGRR